MKFAAIILKLLILVLLPFLGAAQTYYQVTDTNGTQNIGGNNVAVSRIGCGLSALLTCGVMPYRTTVATCGGPGGYKFVFANPVTILRSHLTIINPDDTIAVKINGTHYTMTSSNISSYLGTCSCSSAQNIIVSGNLTTTAPPGFYTCAQIDIQPGYAIDSIEIYGITGAGGVIFDLYFAGNCLGNAAASSSHDTICAGDTLHLFANTTSVSAATTYNWTGPNGFMSSAQDPVINNVSTLAAGTYTLTVTDTGSCVYISPVNIVVDTVPAVITSSNSPLCPGDTLKLFSTSANNISFTWSGPDSFSSSAQNPVIIPFTASDTGYYNFLATASNGCNANFATHVSFGTLPVPSISYNYPLCAGDTLKLSAGSPFTGVSYNWTGPNNFVSNIQDPFIANTQTTNGGTYSVTVTNGCSGTASLPVIITAISGPPAISISVSPNDTICAGDNITLTAIASNAGNAPGYQWKKNGINISGATAAVYTMGSLSNGDVITCKVTGNAPCQPVDTATSTGIHMHVVSLPPPLVSVSSYPANYVAGDTVTFTGHIPAGSTGLTYQWMKNGVIIPGANNIFYTSSNLSAGDSICLVVHSSIHCTFPDSVVSCIQITTGITNVSPCLSTINVYPNPNNGNFTISGNIQGSGQGIIEVINMLGQLIYKEAIQSEHHIFEKQLFLGKVATGVYTLLLKTENEYIVNKIIVKP